MHRPAFDFGYSFVQVGFHFAVLLGEEFGSGFGVFYLRNFDTLFI